MFILLVIQAGVQRAAALCRGSGCPRKTFFLLFRAPAAREREGRSGAQPHTPG